MRNRKIAIPIVIVLVISIISLGVAFAAFSTTLNINGSAKIEATSWDIFFTTENDGAKPTKSTTVPAANISNSGTTASSTSASIEATTFTWNANFKSPGDKIIYTIYVKNGGNYNARVSSISTPTISCTTDPKNVCNELSYGLYTDTAGNTPLSTSFTVDAGDTEVFYLIAILSENYGGTTGANLASTDVTTNTISATVTFEQVSSAVSNNNNSGNSGGSSTPASGAQYLTANDTWTNNISEASSQNVYIKRTNNKEEICALINSTEHCFDETVSYNSLIQFCTSVGGTVGSSSGEDMGCNGGEKVHCSISTAQGATYTLDYDQYPSQGEEVIDYVDGFNDIYNDIPQIDIKYTMGSSEEGCHFSKSVQAVSYDSTDFSCYNE